MRRQVIDSYTRCINLGAILLWHSLLSRNKLRLRYRVPRILLFLYTCRKYHAIKNNARAYACEWIFAVVNETFLIFVRGSPGMRKHRATLIKIVPWAIYYCCVAKHKGAGQLCSTLSSLHEQRWILNVQLYIFTSFILSFVARTLPPER